MGNWQEIVRRANEDHVSSQAKKEEAKRKFLVEDEAKMLKLIAKIQTEGDDVFKKFSVRETLDAIRKDLWKEGEVVELTGPTRFDYGGLELRAQIRVPVVRRHYEHYSGGNSQADSYSGDIEHIDGIEMNTTFMTIGVTMQIDKEVHVAENYGKSGRALHYGVSPYVNMEWITRELKGKPFSKASLKERVKAGESLRFGGDYSNRVFVDYSDAQSEFVTKLALNISGAALPQQIRQVFST